MLIHWNAAEAEERAARLRRSGHEAEFFAAQGGAALRAISEDPPDAFVIDLGRLPSHGSAVATMLRQQKATRRVPILFVGGEPGKVARVRALLPDAVFARSAADLKRRFSGAARGLAEGGRLWIAWPKRASGANTDLTQAAVRAFGLGAGFVDYKICAIDETWSGLCFTRRGASPAR